MTTFKPLNIRKYQKRVQADTPDTLYWQRLSVPTLVKEFGGIDYVDFSPVEPYCFAVTCSVRVQIYNPATKLVIKNLSRFQETAYGGSFRQDGTLLVAGDEQGLVKLFDTSSKNVLRLFKGHTAPVHRTFFAADQLHIASFSDDRTVRLWDVAKEKTVHTYGNEHNDYIRAGAMNPVSANIFVSGGYDGKIKVYDTRTEAVTNTIDHGCPIESIVFLPSGGIFITAGGTELRVWDLFAGGRLLTKLSQHHKTITSLRLGSNGRRLFSAGLDRHVKIYDIATYQTVHTLTYPNAVLSLGVAAKDQAVVAGMVDGLISIRTMSGSHGGSKSNQETRMMRSLSRTKRETAILKVDHVIKDNRNLGPKLAAYDRFFRQYEYNRALTSVVTKPNVIHQPELIVAVMQELIQRKGLHRALVARSYRSLQRIVSFIVRYIGEHRFMRVLTDVTNELLDIYEHKFHDFNEVLARDFVRLAHTLQQEVEMTHELLELQGSLETLFMGADTEQMRDESMHFLSDEVVKMKQSTLAKDFFVVEVK